MKIYININLLILCFIISCSPKLILNNIYNEKYIIYKPKGDYVVEGYVYYKGEFRNQKCLFIVKDDKDIINEFIENEIDCFKKISALSLGSEDNSAVFRLYVSDIIINDYRVPKDWSVYEVCL